MPPGRGSKRVYLDANAAIDCARERTLHDLGRRPANPRVETLRKRLARTPGVFVTKAAAREAHRNLLKDLMQNMSYEEADRIVHKARRFLRKYCRARGCNDVLDHVSAAREMYSAIRGDPDNQKFSEWMRKKSRHAVDPVLGHDENDLRILSTAAHHAQQHAAELWTHDMDFTMFADEIRMEFGLKVVDSHRLGG